MNVYNASGAIISSSSMDINGLTAENTPVVGDKLPFYDISAVANRVTTLENILKGALVSGTSATPATGDYICFRDISDSDAFKIGTIANVLSLSSAAVTAEGCSLYLTSDDNMGSGWTAGTWKQITGSWGERTDVGGYSAAGAEPTVPSSKAGKFWATAQICIAWGGAYSMFGQFRVNGTAVSNGSVVEISGASSTYGTLTLITQLTLAVGDVVSVWGQPSGANDVGTLLGNGTNCRSSFEVWRIGD